MGKIRYTGFQLMWQESLLVWNQSEWLEKHLVSHGSTCVYMGDSDPTVGLREEWVSHEFLTGTLSYEPLFTSPDLANCFCLSERNSANESLSARGLPATELKGCPRKPNSTRVPCPCLHPLAGSLICPNLDRGKDLKEQDGWSPWPQEPLKGPIPRAEESWRQSIMIALDPIADAFELLRFVISLKNCSSQVFSQPGPGLGKESELASTPLSIRELAQQPDPSQGQNCSLFSHQHPEQC